MILRDKREYVGVSEKWKPSHRRLWGGFLPPQFPLTPEDREAEALK
jgi:hypothetical protein